MTADEQVAFMRAVLALGDGFNGHGDLWENIWWRTDDEYAPVTFFVRCNDLFYWASADAERITPENLPALAQAVADVRAVTDATDPARDFDAWYDAGGHGADLFCARQRKMRPQRPCYQRWADPVKALFDACGPERDRKDEG